MTGLVDQLFPESGMLPWNDKRESIIFSENQIDQIWMIFLDQEYIPAIWIAWKRSMGWLSQSSNVNIKIL